jgi:DNA-binding winged helix-turn-helix (wHTH) protein/tetratricopeptide (TPR) repeat protein
MTDETSTCYEFDRFRVDPVRRLLLVGSKRVSVPPKAFDLLLILVRSAPRVLGTEELMETLWPETFVEESNLTQNVFVIRKALGEVASEHRYVVTIPRKGYCFVCPVRRATETSEGTNVDAPGEIAAAPRRIAVLPFHTLGGDPHDEYLAQGLAETLSYRLTSISRLVVQSTPAAVLRQSESKADPLSMGRRLDVDSVLCGTLQRSGERVRINARIVRVRDGSLEWTKQLEAELKDIFAFQDLIVDQVVRAMTLELTRDGRKRLNRRYTENTEAYLIYLRGRYYWNKRTPLGFQMAAKCFEQACDQDPTFALAYTGLADCLNLLAFYNLTQPLDACVKAKAAAVRALEIDSELAEAHVTLGIVRLAAWDWHEAESECQQALALNPNYAFAFDCYAECCCAMGRHAEAIAAIRLAQELEPLSLIINCDAGRILFHARRYEESVDQLRHTIQMDPGFAVARWALGSSYQALMMHKEARSEFEDAHRLFDEETLTLSSLGRALAAGGDTPEARSVLQQLVLLRRSKKQYVSPYDLALLFISLNQENKALGWLEKALDEHPFSLIYLNVDPRLDPLRPHARFKNLLKRIGFPLTPKESAPDKTLPRYRALATMQGRANWLRKGLNDKEERSQG